MSELFNIPPSLSPRLLWMQRHGICTWHQPDNDEAEPWVAFIPETKDTFGRQPDNQATIDLWTPVWDNDERSQDGKTEDDALTALAVAANLRLWFETQE